MCEVDPIIRPPCRDYPFPIPISMSDQTTNDEQAGYAAEPKGLIPSPNLPGVSYNAEGIPVNKDGKPINIMDEPKRGPMLSDVEIEEYVATHAILMHATDVDGIETSHGNVLRKRYSGGPVPKDGDPEGMDGDTAFYHGGIHVRDFYEAKITSGELMVVKLLDGTGLVNMIPVREWKTSPLYCDDCGTAWMQKKGDCYTDEWEDDSTPCFCPGCGAKIVEA